MARHPGKYLDDILYLNKITQQELAKAIDLSRQLICNIMCCRRNITPDVAYRLGVALGTGTQYWLDKQLKWDLEHVENKLQDLVINELIKPKETEK